MKTTRLFAIASAIVMIVAGCAKTEDIDKLQDQLDKLQNERIKTVDEQVAGIKNSLGSLQTTSTELQGFIQTLQNQEAALERTDTELAASIAGLKNELSGNISTADANCLAALEAYKSSVNTELNSIRAAITALQTKDTELQTQINNLKSYADGLYQQAGEWATATFATLENFNATAAIVSSIQSQIPSIIADIQSLQNASPAASLADLNNAISGLREELQPKVQKVADDSAAALEAAVSDVNAAYTEAFRSAIAASETSIKSWVNEKLAGYYTIVAAETRLQALRVSLNGQVTGAQTYIEGLISALQTSAADNSALVATLQSALDDVLDVSGQNTRSISGLQEDLVSMKTDLTTAYTTAISTAISSFDGRISGSVATSIGTVNSNLNARMQAVDETITSMNGRLTTMGTNIAAIRNALPGIKADIAKLLARIQSLNIVPTASGNTVGICDFDLSTVTVEVLPLDLAQELVSAGTGIFSMKAVYTQTKAESRFVDLPVSAIAYDGSLIKLTVSGMDLEADFFDGAQGARAMVCISDGNNERTSGYVALSPVNVPRNLSMNGTANCYVVSKAGSFRFNATVQGNSTDSVGTPASAEVLWESLGTAAAPSVGAVIASASYADGYVSLTTADPLVNGNAVIAVKDASGTILWSWHIWVCSGFDPVATGQVYRNNAGTMMDRNLGALSATPGDPLAFGLLWQWGRKDPFPGGCSLSLPTTRAGTTITWPSRETSTSETGTIEYAIQHPTVSIGSYSGENRDWFYTGDSSVDETRWQPVKTKYDPCPAGWHVPEIGMNGPWGKAFGRVTWWQEAADWDATNKGCDFGSTSTKLGDGVIWYPAAGGNSQNSGFGSAGRQGWYWSCSPGGTDVRHAGYFIFDETGMVFPWHEIMRAASLSVRCQAE